MTTLAVANQKGGVAKTTTTHALGVAFAEQGQRVLMVDLDPQASLTWACGVDPEDLEVSVHDLLLKRANPDTAIITLEPPARRPSYSVVRSAKKAKAAKAKAPASNEPGVLDLLPSTIDLAGAELHLLTKTGREYVLRKALSKVTERYDWILLDCPPSLGILTINGLTAADEVLVPLQCESLGQRGVGQLLDTIADVRDYTNESLRVRGAVATLFDGRTNLAHRVVSQVEEDYEVPVFEPYVPKSVKVAEAPELAKSVLTHASGSKAAAAYREIAAKILADAPVKGRLLPPQKTSKATK